MHSRRLLCMKRFVIEVVQHSLMIVRHCLRQLNKSLAVVCSIYGSMPQQTFLVFCFCFRLHFSCLVLTDTLGLVVESKNVEKVLFS